METGIKFRGKQGINRPLPDNPRLPREIRTHDHHIKMCFPFGSGAGMAGMHVRVVPHLDPPDIESILKCGLDAFCTIHRILQRLMPPTYLRACYCL